eukprot:9835646-Lingulodinium_polyedra.AAC.1
MACPPMATSARGPCERGAPRGPGTTLRRKRSTCTRSRALRSTLRCCPMETCPGSWAPRATSPTGSRSRSSP